MEKDVEAQKRTKISHFRSVIDQGVLTPEIKNHHYKGSGTDEDPYVSTTIRSKHQH